MSFEFWLKDEKGKIDFLLPVTPSLYEIEYGNTIEVVDATSLGDINLATHRRLMNIGIEGLFPHDENDYEFVNRVTYAAANPIDYVELVKRWVNEKSIIRLVITDGEAIKINATFFVEYIKYSENETSNRDISYTIMLREYRPLKVQQVMASAATENKTRQETQEKKAATTYTVKSGDNLSKIARNLYGDATKWKKIYEANKSVIGKNPNLIFPGQVYAIP